MSERLTLHICPNNCGSTFGTTAQVSQDWEVSATGDFQDVINDCSQVVSGPQSENLWTCLACGSEAQAIDCYAKQHKAIVGKDTLVDVLVYIQSSVPLRNLPRAFMVDPDKGGVFEAEVTQNPDGKYAAQYGAYRFIF